MRNQEKLDFYGQTPSISKERKKTTTNSLTLIQQTNLTICQRMKKKKKRKKKQKNWFSLSRPSNLCLKANRKANKTAKPTNTMAMMPHVCEIISLDLWPNGQIDVYYSASVLPQHNYTI